MTLRAHKLIAALEAREMACTYDQGGEIIHGSGFEELTLNDWLPYLADEVRRSAKFYIGRTNLISEALYFTGFDYLKAGIWRPPFPVTYMETVDDNSRPGSILLIEQPDFNRCMIFTFGVTEDRNYWIELGAWSIIEYTTGTIQRMFLMNETAYADKEGIQRWLQFAEEFTIGVIALLDAKGCDTELVAAPERLNKRRAAKGRPPLYEHRIIKIGGISKGGRVIGVGGTHASPRTHWRRGHVRTLWRDTSKQRAIPIPAVLVAKASRGFISHDYEIERPKVDPS